MTANLPPEAEGPAAARSWIGETVDGRFRVLDVLAQGAGGPVLLAEDTREHARVALKVLEPGGEAAARAELEARFERETVVGARVQHPAIASALEARALDDGTKLLVLEHFEGASLRELLAWGPLEAKRAARIGEQIARALAVVHEAGVVHRDVKLRNVLVDASKDDFVKLVDFGFAKVGATKTKGVTGPASRVLATGGVALASLTNLPPEAKFGAATFDERSDLYALGVVLYEMLTGRRPFDATDPSELARDQQKRSAPTFAERAPDAKVPAALESVVLRLLERERSGRYPSAASAADAIAAAVREGATPSAPRAAATLASASRPTPTTGLFAPRPGLTSSPSIGSVRPPPPAVETSPVDDAWDDPISSKKPATVKSAESPAAAPPKAAEAPRAVSFIETARAAQNAADSNAPPPMTTSVEAVPSAPEPTLASPVATDAPAEPEPAPVAAAAPVPSAPVVVEQVSTPLVDLRGHHGHDDEDDEDEHEYERAPAPVEAHPAVAARDMPSNPEITQGGSRGARARRAARSPQPPPAEGLGGFLASFVRRGHRRDFAAASFFAIAFGAVVGIVILHFRSGGAGPVAKPVATTKPTAQPTAVAVVPATTTAATSAPPSVAPTAQPATSATVAATASPATTGTPEASGPRPTEVDGANLKTWRARLKAVDQTKAYGKGAQAIHAIAQIDPTTFESREFATPTITIVTTLALNDDPAAAPLFELLGTKLGERGPALLFDIIRTKGGTKGAERAAEMLSREDVMAKATPGLRAAFALRSAKCKSKLDVLPRAVEEGDYRALSELTLMREAACDRATDSCCFHDHPKVIIAARDLKKRLDAEAKAKAAK